MKRATAAGLTLPIIFAVAGCDPGVESAMVTETVTAGPEVVTVEPEDVEAEEEQAVTAEQEVVAVESEDVEAEAGQAEQSTAAGTRSDPIPVGEVAVFSDGESTFEVSIGASDFDATDAIMDEAMARGRYFELPAPDTTFVLVPVTVTYYGDDSIYPYSEVDLEWVTAEGDTYWSGLDIGVPDDMVGRGFLTDGDTATGNYVFLVLADEIGGAVYAVEVERSGDTVFFATGY